MADYALPILTSTYSDLVDVLKARDDSAIKWLDGTTDSNLPSGAKRWNDTNSYFEKFNGSAWSPLAAKYMINVGLLDGCTVNDGGSTTSDLWTASKVTTQLSTKLDTSAYTAVDVLTKIKNVDGSGSGLDADLLDGMNTSSTNVVSTIVNRDASGNFSAGTITATLSGTATTANALNAANGYTVSSLTVSTGVLRIQNFNGVATDGITYYGNANSYIYKNSVNWTFNNEQSGFNNILNTAGQIVTANGQTWAINVSTAATANALNTANSYTGKNFTADGDSGLRTKNFNNIITDGVIFFGNGSSYMYKLGTSFRFYNQQSLIENILDTSGNIVTADGSNWNIKASALTTVVGSAPSYACRAWVNFNGTGTVAIRASGNVSSITDNGTGNYTVNFTTAMTDANYSASAFGKRAATPIPDSTVGGYAMSASQLAVYTANGNGIYEDFSDVHIHIVR